MICLWLQVWRVCFYPSAWHSRCFESGAWEADKTWKPRCEVLLVHACGKMLPWEMSPGSKPGQGSCCVYPEACEAMRGSLTDTFPRVLLLLSVQCHNTDSHQMIWFLLGLQMRRKGWREKLMLECGVLLLRYERTCRWFSHSHVSGKSAYIPPVVSWSVQSGHTHVDQNTFHTRAHYLVTYELDEFRFFTWCCPHLWPADGGQTSLNISLFYVSM